MDPALNVLGGTLKPCSMKPLTGFFRDGCCNTGAEDRGRHTVCVIVTAEFLALQEVAKTPWARLIITEVAQSLFVDGYRHGNDAKNSPIWDRIWQPNGNDARQIAVHRAANGEYLAK